ncbi:hypothetical protein [Rhizobium sp. No.120]
MTLVEFAGSQKTPAMDVQRQIGDLQEMVADDISLIVVDRTAENEFVAILDVVKACHVAAPTSC